MAGYRSGLELSIIIVTSRKYQRGAGKAIGGFLRKQDGGIPVHHFFLLHTLAHITLGATLGFFVLFAASKAEGFVSLLGKILGIWLLLLAVAGLACTGYGIYRNGGMAPGGVGYMHPGMMMEGPPPPPASESEKAPAASPAPAAKPAAK